MRHWRENVNSRRAVNTRQIATILTKRRVMIRARNYENAFKRIIKLRALEICVPGCNGSIISNNFGMIWSVHVHRINSFSLMLTRLPGIVRKNQRTILKQMGTKHLGICKIQKYAVHLEKWEICKVKLCSPDLSPITGICSLSSYFLPFGLLEKNMWIHINPDPSYLCTDCCSLKQ